MGPKKPSTYTSRLLRAGAMALCLLGVVWRGGAAPDAGAFVDALAELGEAQRTPEAVAQQVAKRWAFAPITNVTVPQNGMANPIDAFLREALLAKGLDFSAPAPRATLIRRLYLDVLGLPPTPEEVDAFVQDPDPGAYTVLVDRVLASPHFGERWARHWLDVVRFGETNGFETNTPRLNAWPYRDWVIAALNEDRPYDAFVRQQIVGDALGEPVATGFLVAGPWDEVKSPDVVLTRNQRDGELHDMVSTVGSAILGLTVGCAKCHDHKFDPVRTEEYYRLRACLAGVRHGEQSIEVADAAERKAAAEKLRGEAHAITVRLARGTPLAEVGASPPLRRVRVSPQGNADHFAPVRTTALRFTVLASAAGDPCIDELEVFAADTGDNVALASRGGVATASSEYPENELHKIIHLNDGLFGNSHSWIPAPGKLGWVQVDFAQPQTVDLVAWARDRDGGFKDRVVTAYRIEVKDEAGQWHEVASDRDRIAFDAPADPAEKEPDATLSDTERTQNRAMEKQREALLAKARVQDDLPKIYAGRFEQPEPTHLLYRGDPMMERDAVTPGGVAVVLAGLSLSEATPEQGRRMALAKWLTNPQNPLTPRVIVNRIWQHHFGTGIVDTPSDFGAMGSRPTHPALLDWLAGEHLRGGWRMKAIHREILLSQAYQQGSQPNPAALAVDAGSRLIWRFPPRRLEAEPIRDTILAVTGVLDLRMGGPGYEVFEPDSSYVHIYIPKEQFGGDDFRRMIYQFKPRKEQDITFGAFDCPDATQSAARRNRSTTPLQALNLLNSPFMQQQAGLFAARLHADVGDDVSACIARGFALALGRRPEADEAAAADTFVAAQGLASFCRALLNTSEFLYLN